MYMTLANFEDYIEYRILARGLYYFKNGNIESLELDGDVWQAEVCGSDDYIVTVSVSADGEITSSYCDCPYDMGDVCKHEVAVYYALREGSLADKPAVSEATRQKNSRSKESLEQSLAQQSQQALVSVLLEIAHKHPQIKDELRLRFAENAEIEKRAKSLISSSVKAVKRRGFVEYNDVFDASSGAQKVLDIAESRRPAEKVSLCILVLREMMDLLECCDDSDGFVGGVINDAIYLLNEATKMLPASSPESEMAFEAIYRHAGERIYNGWIDWRLEILRACIPLCGVKKLREKLEARLSELSQPGDDDWYNRYTGAECQKLEYELINRFDGGEAAEAFLTSHLENSDFRKLAVQNALAAKDWDKALRLCFDGEAFDAERAGLVSHWRQTRYRIYEIKGERPAMRELAEAFVCDGEFAYYPRLKELCPPAEWPDLRASILARLREERYYHDTYLEILIHEVMKHELLGHCRNNPGSIARLARYLLPDYRDEAQKMCLEHIRGQAMSASSRPHYKNVCASIKAFKKLFDTESARAIRDELQQKYPRRPAFLDELSKLKL